ncbi:MAG: hypothetical protein A3F12_06180 [Gammaproteobacteria bacterium RIFCSPHIGHO2_12_FULL_38_14]|nr:MAG: hypothetical protein A3F12_06180 [Gammaproteobacteria bacterium RIFCSPHIGHO2_12_FULL_38_14]
MLLIILISMLVMVVFLFFMIDYMRHYITLKQRLERLTSSYIKNNSEFFENSGRLTPLKKQYIFFSRKLLNYLSFLKADTTKTLNKRLVNAGWLSKNALIIFLSVELILFVFSFFLAIMLILFLPFFENKSFLVRASTVIVMMWFGYRLPEMYLSRKIKAYRSKIKKSLYEFFDLFLICIEAGFANDKALERVSKELEMLHPEICEQATILITELNILPNRNMAWNNFIERIELEEVRTLVQLIKQSEKLGASLSQSLRAQLELFRSERLSLVEQKAMRLPTTLTIPLVLFIFPALLIVLLGPAFLQAMEIFSSTR